MKTIANVNIPAIDEEDDGVCISQLYQHVAVIMPFGTGVVIEQVEIGKNDPSIIREIRRDKP